MSKVGDHHSLFRKEARFPNNENDLVVVAPVGTVKLRFRVTRQETSIALVLEVDVDNEKRDVLAVSTDTMHRHTTRQPKSRMFSIGQKFAARAALQAGSVALVMGLATNARTKSHCEADEKSPPTNEGRIFKALRKETTLREAVSQPPKGAIRRSNTKDELSKLRASEKEMLLRWERDEDGWRNLPARAWPSYQPKPEELKTMQAEASNLGCDGKSANDLCTDLLFNIATTLVFYNVDPEKGFHYYQELAHQGHVDSMVACGIMLVEGFGIEPEPEKGIEWLRQAILQKSAQACYELGTCLYTGIDGILEEDPEGAYALFQRAADQNHTGGLYMAADCLVEGEGTKQNVANAVPLFYRAAERGHRYSRQRIRELLAMQEYQS